ncbi:hypothetical protein PMZ80_000343 [Knufia obscura]|uniref:Xylanolytic transcriptional activator regulatory domain-containing protein n=2 Tax=Knufia TaxID=430999 RepID=A0AAN8F4X9_9EURO|nr:hypothetical protein PMZ80_000343 [Knufia obscura]KAK5956728.1 hypothetical protein OHC33_002215 [Knufia fluminis]
MFLAPALDSVSQKKLNEIKEKMGTLERTLEEDVARRKSEDKKKLRLESSADLPGEGSESEEGPVPEDERGLEATPLATVDAAYEDNEGDNDDILDLGFRVGKFRMTERLGGLFRPKLAEEMVFALVRDNKRGTEPEAPLKDDVDTFLDPGPAFIAPGSGFIFGDSGTRRSLLDFLPTKAASDLLMKRYHTNCHFLARVVHWPTFQVQYNTFWDSILSGIEPPASLQALVFAMCFSAIASMSYSEVDSVFQQTHRQVLTSFQQATEVALGKAHCLRTTKFDTLQAFIIYLVPMCRGEISRAHSVLVGAAIRLGECFGLHRDPVDAFGHAPVDAHIRRLAWFQLCFLDFKTAEAQGPRPSIKREDYDTKMPWNLDDTDLLSLQPGPNQQIDLREKEGQWTDATLSKIRFECTEMHRVVWHDRVRLDKQKISITYALSKVEAFRTAMEEKYAWLDISITLQHYARILLDVLLLRMHIMILHKYHNATSTRIPDRLRQIIINSGTRISESAVKLDIDPKFECFKWYNSALQQWHTAFLLLVEVFVFPNRREADRIWSIADHVFEPDLTLTRVQKARSILGAVRDRAVAYREVRRLREPVSMRNRLSTSLPARGRIRGPEMILPPGQQSEQPTQTQTGYPTDRSAKNTMHGRSLPASSPSDTNTRVLAAELPQASSSNPSDSACSWHVESPFTYFVRDKQEHTDALASQANFYAEISPQYTGVQHPGEPSPSGSSHLTEPWPPSISNIQQATYRYTQNAASPLLVNSMSPPDYPSSPPALYGNSAMGLVSGQYMPSVSPSVTPGTETLSYSTREASTGNAPVSPEAMRPNMPSVPASTTLMNLPGETAAWGPIQTQQTSTPQDIPMLDIDWSEWDKLFPVEVNNGDLDLPEQTQTAY